MKGTKKTPTKVGRPTSLVPDLVTKLEETFKIGGTVEEACACAGISKMSYYRYLKDNPDFVTKMEAAQHFADVAAKNVVTRAIIDDEDLSTSKWWLEKRQFNQPQTQVNIAGQEMSIQFVGDDE